MESDHYEMSATQVRGEMGQAGFIPLCDQPVEGAEKSHEYFYLSHEGAIIRLIETDGKVAQVENVISCRCSYTEIVTQGG
jgi:hypothetical protein